MDEVSLQDFESTMLGENDPDYRQTEDESYSQEFSRFNDEPDELDLSEAELFLQSVEVD